MKNGIIHITSKLHEYCWFVFDRDQVKSVVDDFNLVDETRSVISIGILKSS